MHDEASPSFADMIDQTTLGHRLLLEQFNVTVRFGLGRAPPASFRLPARRAYPAPCPCLSLWRYLLIRLQPRTTWQIDPVRLGV